MKNITIFTFLFFTIFYSIGQDKKISLGLISSIEYNEYDFKETDFHPNYDYKSNTGYSIGLGLDYQIQEKIFVKSGLTYSILGYQLKYNYLVRDPGDPLIPRKSELTVSYISIPLMIGYQVMNFGNLRFNPSFGLNFGFQIS